MENTGEILLYRTEDDRTEIQVTLQDETVWLSQAQMAELFQKSIPTINEHIKNAYDEGELDEKSTIRNFRIVQTEKKRRVTRTIEFYNLDVIISIGYRVKSHRGTQFRITSRCNGNRLKVRSSPTRCLYVISKNRLHELR